MGFANGVYSHLNPHHAYRKKKEMIKSSKTTAVLDTQRCCMAAYLQVELLIYNYSFIITQLLQDKFTYYHAN